jgi:serine/threonine protein kinase
VADDQRTQNAPAEAAESGHQSAVAPAADGADATEPGPSAEPAPPAANPKTSYLPAAVDPLLGQTLAGRYQIVKKLGEGGMGSVYLATHNVLEKQVALKVLHGELARKPDLIERFMQEAKAASRIRHQNVIDISDFGATAEGHVFFAMELLSGHDLHDEIGRARIAGELLPWERSKHIFLQICSALAAAHKHGVVHRDLKPENVYLIDMLGDTDFVKLLDFGIAKLTEVENTDRKLTKTGMLFGTPEYMSPEQARGEKVDHRVDIYAMGCILFQLVTGRVPFEADNFMGVLTMHLTEPPPIIPDEVFDSIGAPRELAGVIAQAIAKDRNQRYQTAEELGNAVRLVCGEAPLAAGNSGRFYQRPSSVPAPSETTQRATPVPGVPGSMPASVAASASGASFRATPPAGSPALPTAEPADASSSGGMAAAAAAAALRSTPAGGSPALPEAGRSGQAGQSGTWSGTPSVARADAPPLQKRGSKVPLIVGALVLAGGAAAAVFIMQNRGSGPAEPSDPGSASGAVAMIDAAVPDAAVAVVVPPPPPPPPPPLPEKVSVVLDTKPHGAVVKDLTTGAVFGKTPRKFSLTPGRAPRQYLLTLRGYGDALIEFVPDREKIEHTEELVKGVSGRPTVVKAIGPKRPPDPGPQTKPPDPGTQTKPPDPGTQTKPPDPTPTAQPPDAGTPQTKPPDPTPPKPPDPTPPKPPPDEDCPELPCLKGDPSRRGGGSAP